MRLSKALVYPSPYIRTGLEMKKIHRWPDPNDDFCRTFWVSCHSPILQSPIVQALLRPEGVRTLCKHPTTGYPGPKLHKESNLHSFLQLLPSSAKALHVFATWPHGHSLHFLLYIVIISVWMILNAVGPQQVLVTQLVRFWQLKSSNATQCQYHSGNVAPKKWNAVDCQSIVRRYIFLADSYCTVSVFDLCTCVLLPRHLPTVFVVAHGLCWEQVASLLFFAQNVNSHWQKLQEIPTGQGAQPPAMFCFERLQWGEQNKTNSGEMKMDQF